MKLDQAINSIISRIEADLESGRSSNWKRGWSLLSLPRSYVGREYHGVNHFLLAGGSTNCWITRDKAEKEGGRIKEEATPAYAVLWKFIQQRVIEETGETTTKSIPLARVFEVFNFGDAEEVPEPAWLRKQRETEDKPPIEISEVTADVTQSYIDRAKGLTVDHEGGDRAFYVPSTHKIHLPAISSFHSKEEYYDTLFHELGHSTGHPSLLARHKKGEVWGMFGNDLYSREELVAELCSAMVCDTLGINTDTTALNASAYVRGWMKKIRKDPRILVAAASRGEKAARLIMDMTPKTEATVRREEYTTKKGKKMDVVAINFTSGIPDDILRSEMKQIGIHVAGKKMFWCPRDKTWRVAFNTLTMKRLVDLFIGREMLAEKEK